MTKSIRDRLTNALSNASKADKSLANYMLTSLATLPFETAASIAQKIKVSEPTVGRFCRSLGYRSFKDLKDQLKEDVGDRPWLISDRLRELRDRARAGEDQLTQGLELEIAALVAVYETAQTPEWSRVVKRLAHKKRVFVTGFQTERGMAQVFVNQLQYLRDGVQLIDLAAGNFSEALLTSEESCIVIFEARRYSKLAQMLAHEAHAAGIPVTLIVDAFCDWGHEVANEIFVVPTEFNLFWESTAQMASLANLLVNGVFIELGTEVEERMNKIADLYSRFTGHVGE